MKTSFQIGLNIDVIVEDCNKNKNHGSNIPFQKNGYMGKSTQFNHFKQLK